MGGQTHEKSGKHETISVAPLYLPASLSHTHTLARARTPLCTIPSHLATALLCHKRTLCSGCESPGTLSFPLGALSPEVFLLLLVVQTNPQIFPCAVVVVEQRKSACRPCGRWPGGSGSSYIHCGDGDRQTVVPMRYRGKSVRGCSTPRSRTDSKNMQIAAVVKLPSPRTLPGMCIT